MGLQVTLTRVRHSEPLRHMKDSDWLDLRAVYTVIQKYTQHMGTHRHTPHSHFLMHTLNCAVSRVCVCVLSLLFQCPAWRGEQTLTHSAGPPSPIAMDKRLLAPVLPNPSPLVLSPPALLLPWDY